MNRALTKHIRDNWVLYTIVFFIFIVGIVTGTIATNYLEKQLALHLADYINNILTNFTGIDGPEINRALYQVLSNTVKEVGLIWFLGLTVIGVPLIMTFIFYKGFVLGFTVGFLVQQMAFQGMVFSLLAIFPPNLIYIPALFAAAILAVSFSSALVRGSIYSQGNILRFFASYSLVMLIIVVASMGAGMVEVYLSPFLAKVVLSYFH